MADGHAQSALLAEDMADDAAKRRLGEEDGGVAGESSDSKGERLLYFLKTHLHTAKDLNHTGKAACIRIIKSSVCSKIVQLLGQNEVDHHQKQVVMISQDSFYRILTPEQKSKALKGQFNFDHPDAFDNELILKTLRELMEGKTVQIPVYDFVTHSRKEESETVYPADVILFEGILAFYVQDIRDMFQMKLFVDTDADTRLSRRVLRDINERGRDLEQVLSQYIKFVKPAFEEFCLPTKKYADVIIPRGADNLVAINLIVQHIQDILNGGLSKRQTNGYTNGYSSHRSRHSSESSSSRPH